MKYVIDSLKVLMRVVPLTFIGYYLNNITLTEYLIGITLGIITTFVVCSSKKCFSHIHIN